MSDSLRHRTVAVAVIYDPSTDRFLLCLNSRWNWYAFPMKRFESSSDADGTQAALEAISGRDFPLSLPQATASLEDRHGECIFSDGAHEYTYYDYHIYAIDPGKTIDDAELTADVRWFTYDELCSSSSVTQSTQSIAKALLEDRRVAVAVFCRPGSNGSEFLLVRNKSMQFFFPSTRLKGDLRPNTSVAQVVHVDLGYNGPWDVTHQQEVETLQDSWRFGSRQVRFHFHLCQVKPRGFDLAVSGNALELALQQRQMELCSTGALPKGTAYWGWFTENDLRIRPEMSPSVRVILSSVERLVEGNG